MHEIRAVCAIATEMPEGEPPEWVMLMPSARRIEARDGRRWSLADAQAVVTASLERARGVDLVVDYEHQTDKAEANGREAPAAGWIREMEARADGIWARVEWTSRAKRYLKEREYRYLSPTFLHTKAGVITRVLRAALTNDPAISDLPSIAKQELHAMDETLKKLFEALGLEEGADEATALARVEALKAAEVKAPPAGEAVKALAKAVGEGDDADAEIVARRALDALKAAGQEPDPSQYVGKAAFDEVSSQLKRIQDERAEEKAVAAVEAGMRQGKIPPAQKDWAMAYARKDLEGFEGYLTNAPSITAPTSGVPSAAPPKASGGALSAEEKALCRQLGLSEDDYKKSRDDEETA